MDEIPVNLNAIEQNAEDEALYISESIRRERPFVFDYIFGIFIAAMLASNYSQYNELIGNIGLGISVLFIFTLFVQRYRLEKELLVLFLLYGWTLASSLLSDYRLLSVFSALFFLKVQFVLVVVAFRCTSLSRMIFYLFCLGIGSAWLVVPSLFSSAYLASDERLVGTVGQANAMGSISAVSFVAWTSLFFMQKKWWRWSLCIPLAAVSFRVVLLTASRGSFLTVLAFMGVGGWFIWKQGGFFLKSLLLVGSAMVGIILFQRFSDTQMLQRLAGLGVTFGFEVAGSAGEADAGRLDIIKTALSVFRENPILGAGYGTFRMYSAYVYTHTAPFEFIYGTGLVGTVLYYYVIVSAWLVFRKAKKIFKFGQERLLSNICQIFIITQLVQGLAMPYQNSKSHAVISGVWLGIAWYVRNRCKEKEQDDKIVAVHMNSHYEMDILNDVSSA